MQNNTSIPNTLIFKSRKDYPSIVFEMLWIVAFIVKYKALSANLSNLQSQSAVVSLAVYGFTAYILYELLWNLFGKASFAVTKNQLIISYSIFVLKITKKFSVTGISKFHIAQDDSNNYWGFQGVRFYGKKHVMKFLYNNREVKLPLNLSDFDENALKNLL